ncbi:DUF3850 domain-containing protein [Acinetobacter johnsonii]|uniref:DUF3850 domain-containing protein n=1 Tax=Acinetobacter johnsonii TaxID=40214 RepID=UPI003CEF8D3F
MDIQKNRKEHMLKTDPAVFQDVLDGSKTFEIRFNDRGYQIGDLIVLKETKFTGQQMKSGQPLVYTGREIQKRISYVLGGYGLQDDWVILGIQDIEAAKAQAVPEWISVQDRMPEQGQKVLVFRPDAHNHPHKDPNFKICTYAGADIFINSHFEHVITHWKPLESPIEAQEPAND